MSLQSVSRTFSHRLYGIFIITVYFVNSSLYSIYLYCYLLLTLYYSSSTITIGYWVAKPYSYLSAGVEVWVGLQPGAITPKTLVLSRLH